MIYFQQIEEDQNNWNYALPPGANVILHIGLKSALSAPLVVQPALKNWTGSEGLTKENTHRFDPVYSYLVPKDHRSITLSFQVPLEVKAGDKIQARLQFASIKDCSISIVVSITSPSDEVPLQLFERNEEVELPFKSSKNDSKGEEAKYYNDSLMNLMKGIEGFELLPSRWLVAEMLLNMCESGYEIAQNPEKQDMIRNLQRTIFFKNGTMIVAGSQIINWLSVSTSISSSLKSLTGQSNNGSGRMMHHWEKWLLNMIQADIENMENKGVEVEIEERPSFDFILSKIGGAPDRLFLYFILGVMEISPRVKSVISQVCHSVPEEKASEEEKPNQMFADILNEKGSLQR